MQLSAESENIVLLGIKIFENTNDNFNEHLSFKGKGRQAGISLKMWNSRSGHYWHFGLDNSLL